jgi:hypothetical protein
MSRIWLLDVELLFLVGQFILKKIYSMVLNNAKWQQNGKEPIQWLPCKCRKKALNAGPTFQYQSPKSRPSKKPKKY